MLSRMRLRYKMKNSNNCEAHMNQFQLYLRKSPLRSTIVSKISYNYKFSIKCRKKWNFEVFLEKCRSHRNLNLIPEIIKNTNSIGPAFHTNGSFIYGDKVRGDHITIKNESRYPKPEKNFERFLHQRYKIIK